MASNTKEQYSTFRRFSNWLKNTWNNLLCWLGFRKRGEKYQPTSKETGEKTNINDKKNELKSPELGKGSESASNEKQLEEKNSETYHAQEEEVAEQLENEKNDEKEHGQGRNSSYEDSISASSSSLNLDASKSGSLASISSNDSSSGKGEQKSQRKES